MKLSYSLDKEDFLTFQLFTAAHSPYIKKMRRINWLLIPVLYVIFSIIFYFLTDPIFSLGFLVLAILWLVFYPYFQKRRYEKVYRKHNEEIFKNRFGKQIDLSFTKDQVISKDYSGEGKMKLEEIEEINEISDYYFLKFTTGVSLIIPKQKIDTLDKVKDFLDKLAKKLHIKHDVDLKWEWR